MTEKEKKAIELIKEIADSAVEYDCLDWDEIEAIKIMLNLVKKQEKEINKLNNEIDRMNVLKNIL